MSAETRAARAVAHAEIAAGAVRTAQQAMMAMLWVQFAGVVGMALGFFVAAALLIAATA